MIIWQLDKRQTIGGPPAAEFSTKQNKKKKGRLLFALKLIFYPTLKEVH
ncbi:hypothetical protein V6Z11_A02G179700 [Gossypium hirsutum]